MVAVGSKGVVLLIDVRKVHVSVRCCVRNGVRYVIDELGEARQRVAEREGYRAWRLVTMLRTRD